MKRKFIIRDRVGHVFDVGQIVDFVNRHPDGSLVLRGIARRWHMEGRETTQLLSKNQAIEIFDYQETKQIKLPTQTILNGEIK